MSYKPVFEYPLINGYPIILQYPTKKRDCDRAGRIILVDRGDGPEERFVISRQGKETVDGKFVWDDGWSGGVYFTKLADAVAYYDLRIARES